MFEEETFSKKKEIFLNKQCLEMMMPHFNDDNYWYFCDAVNFLYSRHKLKTSQASDNFLQCFYETSSLPTITLKYFAITWREKSDYLFMHHLFKLIKLMIFAICLCLRNSMGYQIESYGNAYLYKEMYESDCQNNTLPIFHQCKIIVCFIPFYVA